MRSKKSCNTVLNVTVVMPVYNDWDAAAALIEHLDTVMCGSQMCSRVILVDDGSTSPNPQCLVTKPLQQISAVYILRLRKNLGHQRAIAVGLTYIQQKMPCDAVLVMDADGEDRPEDVPRLIEEFNKEKGERVIFAERIKREESVLFKVCYCFYQILHRILIGQGERVGNFSIISFDHLSTLVVSSEYGIITRPRFLRFGCHTECFLPLAGPVYPGSLK